MKVTGNFPSVTKQGEFQNKILSTDAKSSKDARIQFNHQTNLKIVSGQVSVALFGRELAEAGMKEILDTYLRDPTLGPRVFFAVSEGKAKDMLEFTPVEGINSSLYLRTFLEKIENEKESVNYNTYKFIRDYYDDGIDPILPFFIIKDQNISIDGYALFNGDKFVHHLTPKLSSILFMLRKDTPIGTFSIELPPQEDQQAFPEQINIKFYKKKQDITVKINKSKPIAVDIKIKMEGNINEYTGKKELDSDKAQKQVEKEIVDYLTQSAEEFITITKEKKIDPIGIGSYVRNNLSYKEWKKLKWKEVYPTIDINVSIDMKIMDIGQSK